MSYREKMGLACMAMLVCGYPLAAHAQFAAPRSSPGKPVTTTPPPVHDQAGSSAHQHGKTHGVPEQYPSGQPPAGQEPVTSDQQRTKQAAPMQ
ncbi:hypothetical protein [Gluconacetobacter entanii]|uniref:hypothetical protein n=1 Tax=Gluconacetobacter entanii TaxID=108528 RepID=UPI001FC979D9|nr:hypothetical protein [Gluconacetobacter entanii]MCW4580163.1 hypothetical protein [Gluconacetobacter entanii]MCW4584687.1 hypothetical protein [Gluconacetobacter entanii]MCW4588051.1 hypothetical protein [Gluconacetobacter entanii]